VGHQVLTNYLDTGNVYRRRKIPRREEQPITLVNERDGQLHLLRGSPIFVKVVPFNVETLADLLTVKPPPMEAAPEQTMMLCEEDNGWPVSRIGEPPALDEQLQQLKDVQQEWYQKASAKARKQSQGALPDGVMKLSIGVAVALGVAIGAMIIKAMTASDEVAAAALHLVGLA
jgi:hypothetical protein